MSAPDDASASALVGVPSLDLAPVANLGFDARGTALTPEDYFVLTRCDGKTSFRQICVIAGQPREVVLASLAKLRAAGAILLPGEAPPPRPLAAPSRPPTTRPPLAARAATGTTSAGPMASGGQGAAAAPDFGAEAILFNEPGDLTSAQRMAILAKHRLVSGRAWFELLEITHDADRKDIKRAYFRVSKDFHPDRFYGKQLGSFEGLLGDIFKAITAAYQLLDHDGKRAAYLAELRGESRPQGGQSRAERALEIFEHACQKEIMGDVAGALPYFAAAVNLDPQSRYLKRAADACLSAKELRVAEEYVKKLVDLDPRDAGAHRALAKVQRALGQVALALGSLKTASALDPDNEHIAAELASLNSAAASG